MEYTNNATLSAYTEKNGITYLLVEDVYLPLIAVDDKLKKPLGYRRACQSGQAEGDGCRDSKGSDAGLSAWIME